MLYRVTLLLGLVLASFTLAHTAGKTDSPELYVYAASSLRDALEQLAPACEKAKGAKLVFNFGASNDLARQIVAANRADIFISADEDWMERVAQAGLVDADSRRTLLSNRLVVVAPADSALTVARPADLVSPAIRRLALANPEAVPAGKYARVWLEDAGIWQALQDRIVPAADVRAALAAVASGTVEAGVAYRTDARITSRVRILYEVGEREGPRISYAVAVMRDRPQLQLAREIVSWLASPEAASTFERFGFTKP